MFLKATNMPRYQLCSLVMYITLSHYFQLSEHTQISINILTILHSLTEVTYLQFEISFGFSSTHKVSSVTLYLP